MWNHSLPKPDLTDDSIEKTQPNDGRDSEDGIPEQEIRVLEYAVRVG